MGQQKAKTKVAVIVVAAGSGQRAQTDGARIPKQYQQLSGKPVLEHTLNVFLDHEQVDIVVPIIGAEHNELFSASVGHLSGLSTPVMGGDTRQESVLNGLRALAEAQIDIVLVHDGARPLIDNATIDSVIEAITSGNATAALPVVSAASTIKQSLSGEWVEATQDRNTLYEAQTPQGFDFAALIAAHEQAAASTIEHTDDASIMEAAGHKVKMVAGSRRNLKITTPDDFAIANLWLTGDAQMETRTGSGLDIHRFVPGDGVQLAEVKIAHDHSLSGHSDADMALHVLTDAVLGALAEGDIGQHFPPSDDRWKGEPSRTFLGFACGRLAARGGRIINLDLTLMCEAPKIGPHAAQMRANIAQICGISTDRVSVKATTAEKMGFVGRGEGLFAQAVATIEVPADG